VQYSRFDGQRMRTVRVPKWAAILILAASALVGVLFMVLAAGLALIALPVILVAGGVAAWLSRRRGTAQRMYPSPGSAYSGRQRRGGDDVIDGDYVVIDDRSPKDR
jgi:hypothetical protein